MWNPDKNEIIDETNPLAKLKHSESPAIDLKATLLNIPDKELKSFSSRLSEEIKAK